MLLCAYVVKKICLVTTLLRYQKIMTYILKMPIKIKQNKKKEAVTH